MAKPYIKERLHTPNRYVVRWEIPSFSATSGDVYIVGITTAGTFECSCPAFTFRRNECKHIKFVKKMLESKEIGGTVVDQGTRT
jgi:hypothetical protein